MGRSPKKSAGIQSVEVSASLLRALAENAGPMTLTSLAKLARMSLSKAHKYLASFIRIGLVRQDNATGRYMWADLPPSSALQRSAASTWWRSARKSSMR